MIEERWLPIQENQNYMVSNFGNVKSLSRPHRPGDFILKGLKDKDGYLEVTLSGTGRRKIHRLVLIEFCPTDNVELEVNHINGIKSDNRLKNLEWTTSKQNQAHGRKLGLIPNDSAAKLSAFQVAEIRKAFRSGTATQVELARKYAVTQSTISCLCSHKTWKQVS